MRRVPRWPRSRRFRPLPHPFFYISLYFKRNRTDYYEALQRDRINAYANKLRVLDEGPGNTSR